MDNRQSLQEYLSHFRTVEEKRKVYFAIFREMHRYHNNGEYFPKLTFRNIRICYTNASDIHFSRYEKIGFRPALEIIEIKMKNILELAQLMVCSFIEYDFDNPIICMEVLEKNLNELSGSFHPVDFEYLKRVLVDKEYIYYDDYICKLENPNVSSFQEKRSVSENEQAFTNYFLLVVNLAVVLLIFSSMLLYLS